MTSGTFFTPFLLAFYGAFFLAVLAKITLAPICVHKLILIGYVATLPLSITYRQILHDIVQAPEEKSTLQVYEGKVYFSSAKGMGKRRRLGTPWVIIDGQGKSHTLFCATSGSLDMSGCTAIEKEDFERYSGKQAIVYYSDKFGIMEAIIEGEEIYNYDERKKRDTRPLGSFDKALIWVSVIAFVVFIKECLKNLDLLIDYLSSPLRWRRQEILRYEQLLKEKEAKDV
jgi:hypothetical protein